MFIKWLREPLLHFLLIGGLLFLLYDMQNESVVGNNRITGNELSDMLSTIIEGGIIMSRTLSEQKF